MKVIQINKNLYWFLYYGILLVVFITRGGDSSDVPNGALRLTYLVLTLMPIFWGQKYWLPAIFTLLLTLAHNNYSSSYLPAVAYTYFAALFILYLHTKNIISKQIKIPVCIILLLFLSTVVNLITSFQIEDISIYVSFLLLISLSVRKGDMEQISVWSLAIIAAVGVLTACYFLYGNNYVVEKYMEGEDRVGFSDMNYVACIIGFGVLLAVIRLMENRDSSLLEKGFYLIVIGTSIEAMFANASRGSFLALGGALAIIFLFSKKSTWFKILFFLTLAAFLVFLYNNNYMDMLFYRMGTDDVFGGNGRLDIWRLKMSNWSNGNLFNIFFGYGYSGGRSLGGGRVAFHDDFIAMLVEYGIVGLISFIVFLFYPIVVSNKQSKIIVMACIVYLLLVSFSLEPFAAGRFPFYAFWLYAYSLAQTNGNVKVA